METRLLLIQALSPIHAGTGQGVGVIDQPIAREKATDIPFIPGSTLKGVFRDACPEADRTKIFGPDTGDADLHQGAVTFTDARLALLPVRSLKGVFAWVTSPFLLSRLARDSKGVGGIKELTALKNLPKDGECFVSQMDAAVKGDKDSALVMNLNDKKTAVLEDLELTAIPTKEVNELAKWLKESFALAAKDRLCIVSDDVLSFLLETATEVTARIRLKDDTKTVADGALWYEEALPVETVLVSMVVVSKNTQDTGDVFKKIQKVITDNKFLQFGGNATVGRGLCKTTLNPEDGGESKGGG